MDLFNPSEEHRMLREMVRDFTTDKVEPQAEAHDLSGSLNRPLFEALGELGLLGITIPAEGGGAGMDATAAVIVHEEQASSRSSGAAKRILFWFDEYNTG